MDATTLGGLLGGLGGLAAALVAYFGKRGENALNRFNSFTDQLQEERDRLDKQVAEKNAALAELAAQRAADQVEIARLRGIITRLGGEP